MSVVAKWCMAWWVVFQAQRCKTGVVRAISVFKGGDGVFGVFTSSGFALVRAGNFKKLSAMFSKLLCRSTLS